MVVFPDEVISATRLDIASASNRIRFRPKDVLVAMPIVEYFGSEEFKFNFQMIDVSLGMAQRRDTSAFLCLTSTVKRRYVLLNHITRFIPSTFSM